MKRLCAGWCAALVVGGATCVWGQEGPFEKLDANKDGVITADEVEGEEQKSFFNRALRLHDKDGDKELTKAEFAAATQRPAGDRPQADRPRDGERPRTDRPRDGEQPRGDRPRDGERPDRPRDGQTRRPDGLPDAGRQAAEQMFRRWDANEDGRLSADEVPAERREMFRRITERLDAVDEKGITLEQFSRVAMGMMVGPPGFGPGAPPGMPGMAVLRVLDGDANGELSKEEIAGAAAALAKLDRNEDGKLSRDELSPGFGGGFPGRPGEGRPDQPRPDGRPDGRPREGRPADGEQIRARLKEMDTNGDGKISKEEAQGRIKENFESFDANSDGQIDEAEIRARFVRGREGADGRRPEGDRPDRRPPAEGDEKPKEESKE